MRPGVLPRVSPCKPLCRLFPAKMERGYHYGLFSQCRARVARSIKWQLGGL